MNEPIGLKAFFGFKRHPFPPACAPEPLFRSDFLEASLLQAKNALQSRLHLLVTAPAGLGKSSFCRLLMAELNPRDFKPLYLVGQPIGLTDLMRSVAEALGLESSFRRGKAAQLLSNGIEKLAASSGPHPVLVLDEAQQLLIQSVDLLRLLAESHNRTLMSLVLILAQQIRLDLPDDKARLARAIDKFQPRLLILDPFVRLHRFDENSAMEVSALLAGLRALQRRFGLAVLLVHHTRKSNGAASGQTLRGSSGLHAWGDSNLYLRRSQNHLRLSVERRAARASGPFTLEISGDDAPHLMLAADHCQPQEPDLQKKILDALCRHPEPITQSQLRAVLKVRNQLLTSALHELLDENKISRSNGGWTFAR